MHRSERTSALAPSRRLLRLHGQLEPLLTLITAPLLREPIAAPIVKIVSFYFVTLIPCRSLSGSPACVLLPSCLFSKSSDTPKDQLVTRSHSEFRHARHPVSARRALDNHLNMPAPSPSFPPFPSVGASVKIRLIRPSLLPHSPNDVGAGMLLVAVGTRH